MGKYFWSQNQHKWQLKVLLSSHRVAKFRNVSRELFFLWTNRLEWLLNKWKNHIWKIINSQDAAPRLLWRLKMYIMNYSMIFRQFFENFDVIKRPIMNEESTLYTSWITPCWRRSLFTCDSQRVFWNDQNLRVKCYIFQHPVICF